MLLRLRDPGYFCRQSDVVVSCLTVLRPLVCKLDAIFPRRSPRPKGRTSVSLCFETTSGTSGHAPGAVWLSSGEVLMGKFRRMSWKMTPSRR